ncbi:SMI1/KNR4 family protein [Saccharibacillus sp. JS10]|uniref:SMI1/KNR4 family protein n=1 Tax=Saccharibacillus sp. JS10 TaxID=2950552 RepID=UPI00210982F9|nr:SMI1/KNR4 family protein [Saccharibacillus sp. JS10]MCQ4088244.1 SMI1/KNR4 family protein [Saccharibacillus sp. JS10]
MNKDRSAVHVIQAYRHFIEAGRRTKVIWTSQNQFEEHEISAIWNEPLPANKIDHFFASHDWHLPSDYRGFIEKYNGCQLFADSQYGGGIRILDIQEVEHIHTETNLPPHWIPIVWTEGVSGSICIDSKRIEIGSFPYLYFLDAMDAPEECIPIHCDFTTWLKRLIESQGHEFWLWEKYDRLKFQ